MTEFVYFARSGDAIKIGTSTNVRKRIKALATGTPLPPELVAVMAGGAWREKELHRRFAHLRVTGEWFRAGVELMEFIATLPPWTEPPQVHKKSGRLATVLSDEQEQELQSLAETFELARQYAEKAWASVQRVRELGVPDPLICRRADISRATLNRKYGPRGQAKSDD